MPAETGYTQAQVAKWLARICGIEGGFQADPADRGNWTGGETGKGLLLGTKYGISAAAYPGLSIKQLTPEQAADIYTRDYLAPLNAVALADGLVFQLLDCAVNSGIGTANRLLQRAVGVAPDGHIGPVTLAEIAQRSESDLIMLFLAERLDFMRVLSRWPIYGSGWCGRIATMLRYGAEDSD